LAAAFERVYSDGSREYYLYLDTVDSLYNIHEYEGVVSPSSNDSFYRVISIHEIPMDLTGNSTTSTTNAPINILTPPTPTSSANTPTTLAAFIDSLASGYTQMTKAQIAADGNLPSIEKDISTSYPDVSSASVAAVYSKSQNLSTAYLIFYSSTANSAINLWVSLAVADNLKKTTYLITFNQVQVPSSVKS
jgi:hypothetical protein